jgi:hypothetical protein
MTWNFARFVVLLFSSIPLCNAETHEEFLGCDPTKEDCKFIQCGYNSMWTAWIPYQEQFTNYGCCGDRIYDMRKNVCEGIHIVKVWIFLGLEEFPRRHGIFSDHLTFHLYPSLRLCLFRIELTLSNNFHFRNVLARKLKFFRLSVDTFKMVYLEVLIRITQELEKVWV